MKASENTVAPPAEKHERQSASWDLSNAFRNYSTLVVSQIVSAFFSFASVWLVTRYLGTEGYGGVVAIIAASQVAQIFVNWTNVALARYGVEEFVESGKISKSFWTRTLIFLPNTVVFLALSFLWLPIVSNWLKLPPETGWYVLTHFAVLAIWLHVQHALQGAKLPRLQGFLIALERVLIFLFLLILAISGKLNYLLAIGAYIVSPLIMIFAGLVQLRRLVSWRIQFDSEWAKKILKFSIPMIPFSLIGYFSTSYLDAIFISQYLSKEDLGIYSVAYQIVGILMQFPLLANLLLMPLFVTLRTNDKAETVNNYLRHVLPFITLVWGLGCVLFAICGYYFLPVIFGADFNESGKLLLILTISAAINAPIVFGYAPFTNAISATYISTALIMALAVVNLAGNFILIPRYGLIGSVWATNFGYAASLLVAFALIRHKFSIGREWTLQTVLPTILSLAYAAWTNDFIVALLICLAINSCLILIHRDSVHQGVKLLSNLWKYSTTTLNS